MLVRSLAIEFWYVGKYVGRMVSDEMRCLVQLKLFKFLIRIRLSFQFDRDTRIFLYFNRDRIYNVLSCLT